MRAERAQLVATARVVIEQAEEAHPVCCEWCMVCSACGRACLPARMRAVLADLIAMEPTP